MEGRCWLRIGRFFINKIVKNGLACEGVNSWSLGARTEVPIGKGSCRRDSCFGKMIELSSSWIWDPFPCIHSDGGTSPETSAEEDPK